MANAYFSRKVPFGLIPAVENVDAVSFDAYPVEASEKAVRLAAELRSVLENAAAMFENMPAPEEAAQTEADYFAAQLMSIAKGAANG